MDYSQELYSLFMKHLVMDMAFIQESIPCRSRISLFRDLKSIGYLSSYNKAGRYYTLINIPKFDDNGIWRYKEAYFSKRGSLKETVKHLIDNSKNGHTHLELKKILDVRVHNTLLDLVLSKVISRELFHDTYVYTNNDYSIKSEQLAERDKQYLSLRRDNYLSDPFMIIETLRAVIRYPENSAADIWRYLIKGGLNISVQQVDEIFSFYELGKKNSR
jgi:hypothetical protein